MQVQSQDSHMTIQPQQSVLCIPLFVFIYANLLIYIFVYCYVLYCLFLVYIKQVITQEKCMGGFKVKLHLLRN